MTRHSWTMLAAALLATGCAGGPPPARMLLPEPLAARPAETLDGLGGRREGQFAIGTLGGRFERSATNLSLFERLEFDRAAARYEAGDVRTQCRARQTAGSLGILAGALRPYTLECRFDGGFSGLLTLAADDATLAAPARRSGRLAAAGTTLALRSVHGVAGSPLALDAPIGYLVEHEGRAVGAVELNGGAPRVWRPAAGEPLRDAVTHAAIALALVWDPAAR
jgi:hypothetical protein